jgi:hypothetical protein
MSLQRSGMSARTSFSRGVPKGYFVVDWSAADLIQSLLPGFDVWHFRFLRTKSWVGPGHS